VNFQTTIINKKSNRSISKNEDPFASDYETDKDKKKQIAREPPPTPLKFLSPGYKKYSISIPKTDLNPFINNNNKNDNIISRKYNKYYKSTMIRKQD